MTLASGAAAGPPGEVAGDLAAGPVCPLPIAQPETIVLGHGSGGKLSQELLEQVFWPAFANPALERREDAAVLTGPAAGAAGAARWAFTTDAFVVTPLFFPGGDLGQLAVNGTVNDLAVSGAEPMYLSAAFILEEGLEMAVLRRVVDSMRQAAAAAGVMLVTGDTKVVNRGAGDQIYVATSGLGVVPPGIAWGADRIRPGDQILLSGTIADHGIAILTQREELAFEGEIRSDTAALHGLIAALRQGLEAAPGAGAALRALRDPTRGGVAATLTEWAQRAQVGIEIDEAAIPVADAVRGACEILGLDPLHVANEGKLVAAVAAPAAAPALAALRAHALGRQAVAVGRVVAAHPGRVLMRTAIGGHRIIDTLWGEQLPRIC
ncbi:MAG: hydrogenase expression/formation protein HypE [Terriglobales bacterium]